MTRFVRSTVILLAFMGLTAAPALAHPPGDLTLYMWDDLLEGQYIYKVHSDGSGEKKLAEEAPYFASGNTAISPNGKKVAFFGSGEFRTNIFVIRMNGKDMVQLTKGRGVKEDPAWSPDNRKIVADCGGQLCVLKANGKGEPREITDNNYSENNPQWSPDGKWIVFLTDRGIMKVRPDGSDLKRLTRNDLDESPKWSPDSKWIVFNRYSSGESRLYRMRANGERLKRLTSVNDKYDEEHDWAPDGSRLVFTRTDPEYDKEKNLACAILYTIKPNGNDPTKISDCFLSGGYATLSPIWSPNSKRIAYIAGYRPQPDAHLRPAVYTRKRDGSDVRRIAELGSRYDTLFGLDW